MKKLKSILINMELIIVCIIVLLPITWIIMSSFNKGKGLASSSLIPKELTIENYIRLFEETNYARWFTNTLSIAVMNALISVILIMITAWVMSRFNFKGKKAGLLTILILSMFPSFLSMPCTYYGTEIGMDGVYDPGCRKAFDWNQDNWNQELYLFYKKLIRIRNEEPALKYGEVEFIYDNEVFAMKRIYNDEVIYVIINNTKEEQYIDLGTGLEKVYCILLETEIENNLGKIKISPKTAHYIKQPANKTQG